MPTYDYLCTSCNHCLEQFQKITEDALKTCPKCHKDTLQRKPGGGIGLSFTGSGFYATDYKQQQPSSSCCPCGKNNNSCTSKE